MGDIILTTPLLAALKNAYPDASLTYLAETPYIDLLRHHPHVDQLIPLDRKGSNLSQMWNLLTSKFDLAIDLFGNPRSALLIWLSGAKMRIGGDFRGRRHFYTHPVANDGSPKTAIQFHLEYLKPLGISSQASVTHINLLPEESAWARAYLVSKGMDIEKPIIGIHPGATWPAKKWFPDRFAQLANRLAARGYQVLFTMGPGEEELLSHVISLCDFSPPQPEILSLRRLAAVLRQLEVFVSNDCGPLHLAPAVGTKTVGIFGPGEPEIWFPYPHEIGHRLAFHQIDCSRCHRDFCEKMDCMKSIQVEQVFDLVRDALRAGHGQ